MKKWWLSWWWDHIGEFELHSPWWITGHRGAVRGGEFCAEDASVCAAVCAESEDAAKSIILRAYYVVPETLEWRFCIEQPDDWAPFGGRFPRADWMKWE